jgi:xanthine dehydrogenase small subunit
MIQFILNNEDVQSDQPPGTTVLDLVRYQKNLKGTKIGCREGDCGACTVLVGELMGGAVRYRTMTSCLMPLANAAGKHIVTIEGINPADGSLTPVQQAMVDESGTQCGFCTVGFVMSLTGFCLDGKRVGSPHVSKGSTSSTEAAISSIDGNICRCTGYKSIERAAERISALLSGTPASADGLPSLLPSNGGADAALGGRGADLRHAIDKLIVPEFFAEIPARLQATAAPADDSGDSAAAEPRRTGRPLTQAVRTVVGGGTDVYVQRLEAMAEADAEHVFYDESLRNIRDLGDTIELGASVTVTDLLESAVMSAAFPNLYKHLKLVSSTTIRNMATLAGNFVNASPIGDMTIWFLALNAEIDLCRSLRVSKGETRTLPLKSLYLGYKQLAKSPDEYITAIRFKKPTPNHYFNFEKVSKRTYLDIATVNTAIQLKCGPFPGKDWPPPALSEPGAVATGFPAADTDRNEVEYTILDAHLSAGGVAPVPLYLKETSSFLVGRTVNRENIQKANEIMQLEISPILDVRGTEEYKRILLRQLFRAHFNELFGV